MSSRDYNAVLGYIAMIPVAKVGAHLAQVDEAAILRRAPSEVRGAAQSILGEFVDSFREVALTLAAGEPFDLRAIGPVGETILEVLQDTLALSAARAHPEMDVAVHCDLFSPCQRVCLSLENCEKSTEISDTSGFFSWEEPEPELKLAFAKWTQGVFGCQPRLGMYAFMT